MNWRRAMFTLLVFCGSTGGIAQAADDPIDEQLPDVKLYVSAHTMAIVSGATRIETFRIKAPPRQRNGQRATTEPAAKFDHYFWVVGRGKEMGKDFATEFTKVAFDGKSYTKAQAGCFEPGVALRFWKDQESADVLICFHCGNIRMYTTGKDDAIGITFNPQGAVAIRKLAMEAFPDDPEIQKLKG